MSDLSHDELLAAIERERATRKLRKKRGWRLILMIVGTFVLLVVISPLLVYWYWQAQGRELLRAELARIKAAGEPITAREMEDRYKVPAGARDITDIWRRAIAPFGTAQYQMSIGHLPSYLPASHPKPAVVAPLDQPLPASQEEAIQNWLMMHRDQIGALHAAAQEEGEVRYRKTFEFRVNEMLPEVDQVSYAAAPLQWEFQILGRQTDPTLALKNLHTRLTLIETLRHDPAILSAIVRVRLHNEYCDDLLELVQTHQLSDQTLAELQQSLRKLDFHGHMVDGIIGDRAAIYDNFHQVGAMPSRPSKGRARVETTSDGSGVIRGEDCAMSLRLCTNYRNAANQPYPQVIDAMWNEWTVIAQHFPTNEAMGQWRFFVTLSNPPATAGCVSIIATAEMHRSLTDAAIAIDRYQLYHGKLPASINDLVPDFLPTIPLDPYDGKPLRLIVKQSSIRLYSISDDRIDNGGEANPISGDPKQILTIPDIAVEVLKR